ncbi:hypothetical protein HPB51_008974 [Rhipicephalus microplus]|uniref:Uncharacterized protein n=1 Tax=Rhipicephalus microplus TaxID=6941 RepID=A0A9J6DUW3_RHIMP|nr:hypothetical protein HPB51_008974 [Rhipicephalus microplus]
MYRLSQVAQESVHHLGSNNWRGCCEHLSGTLGTAKSWWIQIWVHVKEPQVDVLLQLNDEVLDEVQIKDEVLGPPSFAQTRVIFALDLRGAFNSMAAFPLATVIFFTLTV